jgi:hypothetical protein
MSVTDGIPNSRLSSLQRLIAEIINESGLVMENAPPSSSWEKVMQFAVRYLNADSGAQAIQEYTGQLSNAMDRFKVRNVKVIKQKSNICEVNARDIHQFYGA